MNKWYVRVGLKNEKTKDPRNFQDLTFQVFSSRYYLQPGLGMVRT